MKSYWKSRMESVVNRLMEAKKKRSIDSWLKSKDRLMSLDYFPKNKNGMKEA